MDGCLVPPSEEAQVEKVPEKEDTQTGCACLLN